MESYWVVLLQHLLKWQYQPAQRRGSWRGSITNARNRLRRLGRKNPSLRRQWERMLEDTYPDARSEAAAETGLALDTFPPTCPWDLETQVLELAFYPEGLLP